MVPVITCCCVLALAVTLADVKAIRRGVGRIEVDVVLSTDFNNGLALTIQRTNPVDPVRNIRVITPGFESSYMINPFHPAFLHSLGKYKTVRFMPWMNANNAQPDWSGRTKRSWRSYTQPRPDGTNSGVPIEDMVLLANMVGFEPWFTIPYNAGASLCSPVVVRTRCDCDSLTSRL